MVTLRVQQCEVITQRHLTTKLAHRDGSRPRILANVKLQPHLSKSSHAVLGNQGRRVADPGLQTGQQRLLLLRSEGAPSATRSVKCQAYTGKRAVDDYGYDLYELLGVEKDAQNEEIKRAYRWLQKKCHPDIAGRKGHDMAILLNDAYSVLSDPDRRATYDSATAETAQFAGYTGEPLYSKWFGKPDEDRAVFVEESRCIGCLKCALLAPNTFAIEARYGRARAVNQWLDSEGTLKDAIRACPVDCISLVNKDLLPALEFVMAKQPRLVLGINNYSYVGVRQENVFVGARRFLEKHAKRMTTQNAGFKETPEQREARMAAAEGIHIKAGRWWFNMMYRQGSSALDSPTPGTKMWDPLVSRGSEGALVPVHSVVTSTVQSGHKQFVDKTGPAVRKPSPQKEIDLGPLREAARQRRRRGTTGSSKVVDALDDEEYWTPTQYEPSDSSPIPVNRVEKPIPVMPNIEEELYSPVLNSLHQSSARMYFDNNLHASLRNIMSAVPALVSVTAGVLAGMNGEIDIARSETDLINGPLPASITTGIAMQMFLTAAVWYMIGAVVCESAVFLTTAFISVRGNKRGDQ